MTLLSSAANHALSTAAARGRRRWSLYLELSKARLSALVLVTTAVGFVLAARDAPPGVDWLRFAFTLLGTAFAAAGANALNQLLETRRDALMRRTRNRPLPSGALRPAHGLLFAMAAAYAGVTVLALAANVTAAALAALTIGIYAGLYTPLKTRTTLNTLVGAVCGALPPMIGWVAAAGRVEPGAWALAGLLFVWQIPHFFALAWMYRDDYARGGFAMLPVVDGTGRLTGQVAVLAGLALVPAALAAVPLGLGGWLYTAGAVALGLWMAGAGARLYADRSRASARRLFLTSILYLPLLLCLMVIDQPAGGARSGPAGAVVAAAVEFRGVE